MKITSFDPLIMTTDTESAIKLFEELGFESSHTKDDMDDRADIIGVRMKDPNGFHVDIVESMKIKQDIVSVRMNVDDFYAAREMLEKHGFKPLSEEPVTDATSVSIGMAAPSGFILSLVQHIKK